MCKWDPDLVARFQGFRVTLDRFISYRFHRLLLSFKLHDYRFWRRQIDVDIGAVRSYDRTITNGNWCCVLTSLCNFGKFEAGSCREIWQRKWADELSDDIIKDVWILRIFMGIVSMKWNEFIERLFFIAFLLCLRIIRKLHRDLNTVFNSYRSDVTCGFNQLIHKALVGVKENDADLVECSLTAARY